MAATWDQSNFNRAMREAARFSRRTPAVAVNTAAFHVTLFWISEMEKVPIERMDAELAAMLSPGKLKSGRLSRAVKRRGEVVNVTAGSKGMSLQALSAAGYKSARVPLAVLIIQARSNLLSKYSYITGGRWHHPSPFKGKSRAAGREAMRSAVSRMVKARHRSSGFLASSMLPAADDLRPFIAKGSRGSAPPVDRRAVVRYGQEKGGAIPAAEGEAVATCVIYSNVGLFGKQARGQYEAIWNHGGPAMQRALDKEAYFQMLFVVREAEKEFERRTRAYR